MRVFSLVLFVLYNMVIIFSLWVAIRGLMKKTSSIRPCKLRWAKVDVQTVSEKDIEIAPDFENSAFDDVHYHKTGVRYKSYPINSTAKYSKLKYEYDGKSYEFKTLKYSSGDIGTEIYCRKDKPEITKIFKPKPPILTGAAVSYFIIAGFLAMCEIVVLSDSLIK